MKQNKIIVVVHPDRVERRKLIQATMVRLGFALTPVDAAKLIQPAVYDFDFQECYYVCAEEHNLRESPITLQRMFELASRGLAVVVGMKRLQAEYEFLCEAVYE